MKRNKIKQKLKRGEVVSVPEINRVFSPRMVEMLGLVGYDCVWIDMEHSDARYDQISDLATAARAAQMDVVVRIARGPYSSVIKPLEAGANGLVLPHCMSAEDAREFVRMAKFAPLGLRGMGGGIDSQYGMVKIDDYVKQANEETLLVVMIEDQEAVTCVDGIAAVDGIDVLFVGPGDLSQSYGVTGQLEHPLVIEAMQKISAASKHHGKAWGSVPGPGGRIDRLLNLGAQFINIVNDTTVIIDGFRAARERVIHRPSDSRNITQATGSRKTEK